MEKTIVIVLFCIHICSNEIHLKKRKSFKIRKFLQLNEEHSGRFDGEFSDHEDDNIEMFKFFFSRHGNRTFWLLPRRQEEAEEGERDEEKEQEEEEFEGDEEKDQEEQHLDGI